MRNSILSLLQSLDMKTYWLAAQAATHASALPQLIATSLVLYELQSST